MKLRSLLLFSIACFVLGASQASAQVVWSFGFEDADYTAAGGNAIVFDQTFDGVSNAVSLIDNTYISATTNDFLYGGDYQVATGFDAQNGSNLVCFRPRILALGSMEPRLGWQQARNTKSALILPLWIPISQTRHSRFRLCLKSLMAQRAIFRAPMSRA